MKKIFILFIFLLIPFVVLAQTESSIQSQSVKIKGRLLEKGTRIPLPEVNIFILPSRLKATTDMNGEFEFNEVPVGEIQIVINQTNYQKFERTFNISQEVSGIQFFLERDSYSSFETTIIDQKQKRDQTTKSLKQSQFLQLPGSGGDPVKAVQNLPGVNRVSGFSSQVVIQGSAPQDTRYSIEGHEIPIVFHFGGLTSVVMPEAVEQVDYLSAGYGPEYSRAMGGIISLKTRKPDVKDRSKKGFFFFDNLKAGALVEGKINENSSYLISGRYSYVGLFLRQVLKDNESLNLTVAPEFADLTMIYHNKLSERDDLKIDFLASRDTLAFVLKEPVKTDPSIRGNFKNETNFYRIIPTWTRKYDSDRTSKLSIGVGQNNILVDIGSNYFELKTFATSVRGEWDQKMSSEWNSQLGFDNQYLQTKVDFRLPAVSGSGGVSNPISSAPVRDASVSAKLSDIGLYWRNEIQLSESKWNFMPSIRADQFGLTRERFLSPRLAGKYLWDDSLQFKAATGIYYQAPQPQEISINYGNPDVKSAHALHAMMGFEKDLREGKSEGLIFSANYFRKDFKNLVVNSTNYITRDGNLVPEVYNNSGGGRAQGIETQLKFDFNPWQGWVSYTLSESKRWDPTKPVYDFQYDQTHNLNIVASYEYVRNWKFSGRYRYVTGNPYTPVTGGIFDSNNDVFIPVRGPIYSERQKAFQQLDLRIDKKWILDQEIWSFYLDIQNALNSKNPEQIRYSYDYTQKEEVMGLPILPALGIKGEF
jgi:hypothetical protein